MRGGFKYVLIFGLGTVLIFIFVMFIYRGGPDSIRYNTIRIDFSNMFIAMQENYLSKGCYITDMNLLKERSRLEAIDYSFFINPNDYLLGEDVKIGDIPIIVRQYAKSNCTEFNILAVEKVTGDYLPRAWLLNEQNEIKQILY